MLISGNSFSYSTDILQMHSNPYTGIDLQALQKFCRVFFLQIINFKYKKEGSANVKVY